MAKSKINSLQVFRGFAAFAVVAHHTALSTDAFVSKLPNPVKELFDRGYLGVDFFFVLSGFIIMYAHMDDAHSPSALRHYVLKRLTRIYPAYLPIGVAMVVLYSVMPGFSASGGRDFSLISSLLLMPSENPPALSVAWTLVHELMFYGVFLLFFVSRRWLASGLITWGIVIFIVNYLYTPSGWLRYPLSLLNIEFILGVGAAWMVRFLTPFGSGGGYNAVDLTFVPSALRQAQDGRRKRNLMNLNPFLLSLSKYERIKSTVLEGSRWIAALGVAIALLGLTQMTQENEAYLRLVFALGLAVVIVGFAVREQSYALRWPALLLLMGNASYSIYLIHNPLLSITQRVAGRMGLEWPLAILLGVMLSLLAGWIYYRMVERPALRFFSGI